MKTMRVPAKGRGKELFKIQVNCGGEKVDGKLYKTDHRRERIWQLG